MTGAPVKPWISATWSMGLRAEGAGAAEVNRVILRKMAGATPGAKGKRVRSLQAVWKKGPTFWKERLKKVQVGKHSKNKKGGVLKRVCKASEAKGCRAGGTGRKDRFVCYKAVVKQVFTQELDNGHEVTWCLVS